MQEGSSIIQIMAMRPKTGKGMNEAVNQFVDNALADKFNSQKGGAEKTQGNSRIKDSPTKL